MDLTFANIIGFALFGASLVVGVYLIGVVMGVLFAED